MHERHRLQSLRLHHRMLRRLPLTKRSGRTESWPLLHGSSPLPRLQMNWPPLLMLRNILPHIPQRRHLRDHRMLLLLPLPLVVDRVVGAVASAA